MDDGPVGYLETVRHPGVGTGIEQSGQLVVSQLRWQWPTKAQRPGFAQQFLDGADTELGAGFDLPDRQPGVS